MDGHSKGFEDAIAQISRDVATDADDFTEILGLADSHPDLIRAVLRYVYYGESIKSPSVASLVFGFAKRMLMHDLQSLCEEKMKEISKDNVVTILSVTGSEIADSEASHEVYQKALSYLVENIAEINIEPLRSQPSPVLFDIIKEWKAKQPHSLSSSSSSSSQAIFKSATFAASSSSPSPFSSASPTAAADGPLQPCDCCAFDAPASSLQKCYQCSGNICKNCINKSRCHYCASRTHCPLRRADAWEGGEYGEYGGEYGEYEGEGEGGWEGEEGGEAAKESVSESSSSVQRPPRPTRGK